MCYRTIVYLNPLLDWTVYCLPLIGIGRLCSACSRASCKTTWPMGICKVKDGDGNGNWKWKLETEVETGNGRQMFQERIFGYNTIEHSAHPQALPAFQCTLKSWEGPRMRLARR